MVLLHIIDIPKKDKFNGQKRKIHKIKGRGIAGDVGSEAAS